MDWPSCSRLEMAGRTDVDIEKLENVKWERAEGRSAEVEVEAAQSEASKQARRCSDAQMSGASAVVVQKLIQRGKDKCRLRELPTADGKQGSWLWSRLPHPTT